MQGQTSNGESTAGSSNLQLEHGYATRYPNHSLEIPSTLFDMECTQAQDLPGYEESLFDQLLIASNNEAINSHGFTFAKNESSLKFFVFSYFDNLDIVKGVVVNRNGRISIYANGRLLGITHHLVRKSRYCTSVSDFEALLMYVGTYSLCVGNMEHEYTEMIPEGKFISYKGSSEKDAFCERNFISNSLTVRASKCEFLIQKGSRCTRCIQARNILRCRNKRKSERVSKGSETFSNYDSLNSPQRLYKLKQLCKENRVLNETVYALQEKVETLERHAKSMIDRESINLSTMNNIEIADMVNELENELKASFQKDSFQDIFFREQIKYNKLKDKRTMRWHPVIIRWCIYIKSKSGTAYEGMRAFLALPSERTLYDYTHCTESGLGFQDDVLEQLVIYCNQNKIFDDEHTLYVGLLQDEVKIKSDLVYDKHSGELIGFTNLNNVSNELNCLEKNVNNVPSELAKYLLVIMVRGVTTNLKYPLASFATAGITADYLYPILWEAIEMVEVIVGLKVLFICCDGASPNRRFFEMHDVKNKTCYRTRNPFDKDRFLYFISDPPHLLKTARNCISNSYSHFNSRRLWNHGDISWMHIVQLYEDYNELSPKGLRLCPKLRRVHIDLTPFSRMNVSLAAQVLSDTVAKALKHCYGNRVKATCDLIWNLNKWFDIMNTRAFGESVACRNHNLSVFSFADDPRLEWLDQDFLEYFDNWRHNVEERPGVYSESEKAKMQLSHQTLKGFSITTKSVIECVRFMLGKGARFVLTAHFNQDPLEQMFGHVRHKGGSNQNPSVFDAINSINTIRAVNIQALAPKFGNTSNIESIQLDHTPVPRRDSHKKL